MNKSDKKRRYLILAAFGMVLGMMIMYFGPITAPVAKATDGDIAERTIIYYNDGASSEEINMACSDMLMEAMDAKFDSTKIRFIVMTGGSLKWHLDNDSDPENDNGYLTFPEDVSLPDDAVVKPDPIDPEKTIIINKKSQISNCYNQVWELFGATDTSEGYMKLIDGDGVTEDGVKSEKELMNNPNTLKAFINYAKAYAPAEKYDLIMLDHGSGPGHGYGLDDHDTKNPNKKLHVYEMREAISECDVVQQEGKFDMIFLECCMNGNFETLLALQDYADFFIGSPDVDPINSVEYTDVLNFLNKDPAMDAKELGKRMVDVFHDYFESHMEERSLGKAVQLSLVDTAQFKNSGILDKMQQIAETLRSEAAGKRFYDEIRSSQDDYITYYSYLQDLSTLAEQLGINIKESDLSDPQLINSYTDAAIQVQNILRDEDVIYSRYTSDSKKDDVIFGRDEDGKITVKVGKTPSGGLNIFFPNMHMANIPAEIVHYIDAMEELANRLTDGSELKNFITTYRQAVIDYALIYEIGTAVSNIVDSEGYDGTVDLDKIREYFEAEDQKLVDQGLEGENQWGSISHIIEKSDRKETGWLNEIIQVQKAEVLDPKNVAIQTKDKDYLIDITNTPQRIIGVPELRLSAKISHQSSEEGFDFLYKDPMIVHTGELAADAMQDVSSFEEFIGGNHSAYRVPLHDGKWYAVQDSKGEMHPASNTSERSVYAAFEFENGTNKGGELHFDEQGNAKYIYLDGDTKPIDLTVYTDPVKVTLMNHPNNAGMVSGEFEIKGTDSRLVKAPYKDLNIKSVDAKLYICDIYGVGHYVPLPKPEPTPAKVSGTLMAKMTAKGKTKLTIGWKKIKGAEGYDIFFAKHGKKIKKVKSIKGNKTFKWTKTKLKKGKSYKATVKAYVMEGGKKKYVRTSPLMYAFTGKGTKKYTNAKSVVLKNVKKGKLSLKKGKTFKIKAKVKKVKKNKKLMPKKRVATLRYISTNKKVATVNKSGKIKAAGKGTCYVYAYAHNGVSKSIKVTVQ